MSDHGRETDVELFGHFLVGIAARQVRCHLNLAQCQRRFGFCRFVHRVSARMGRPFSEQMPVWVLAVWGFVRNIVGRYTAVRHFVSRSGGRSVRSAHAWTMRPGSVSQSVELQERFDQRLFALAHVERQESRSGRKVLAVGQHNRGERSAAEEVGVLKIDARRHKEVGETFRLGRYKRLVGRKGANFRYGNNFSQRVFQSHAGQYVRFDDGHAQNRPFVFPLCGRSRRRGVGMRRRGG